MFSEVSAPHKLAVTVTLRPNPQPQPSSAISSQGSLSSHRLETPYHRQFLILPVVVKDARLIV
jgi:hypothetical protein